MAVDTTSAPSGRLRGPQRATGRSLRVIRGPGMTPDARADHAELEAAALRDDMVATAHRLRMVLMRPIWSEADFAPLGRVIAHEADRLEMQAAGSEEAA